MIVVDGITADELETWTGSVVTRRVLEAIRVALDSKRSDLARGEFLSRENSSRTQASGFEAVGYCKALDGVLNMVVSE